MKYFDRFRINKLSLAALLTACGVLALPASASAAVGGPATSTFGSTSNVTSVNVSFTGCSTGDAAVIAVSIPATRAVTTPSGWAVDVALGGTGSSGADTALAVYRKFLATSSPSLTLSLASGTGVRWSGMTACYSNVNTVTPEPVAVATQSSGTMGTSITAPAHAVTGNGMRRVLIYGQNPNGTTATFTAAAGTTPEGMHSTVDTAVGIADETISGNAPARTATSTRSGRWAGMSLVLNTVPAVSILREMNHESALNPYPGWDAAFPSGTGIAARSTEQAHGGVYSAKLTIDADDSGDSDGIRLTDVTTDSDGEGTLPETACYSAWFYFPQVITVPSDSYWNVFQFKRKTADASDTLPIFSINVARRSVTSGNMYFWLNRHVGTDGGYETSGSGPAASAPGGVDIPTNQWIQLETCYKWSTTTTGHITSWMNGTELWDIDNTITEYDWGTPENPRHWTVNSYSRETSPAEHSIYVDDALITDDPIGPSQ